MWKPSSDIYSINVSSPLKNAKTVLVFGSEKSFAKEKFPSPPFGKALSSWFVMGLLRK